MLSNSNGYKLLVILMIKIWSINKQVYKVRIFRIIMRKYKLKNFYLISWLILSILLIGLYLISGAVEGYFLAIFIEIIFAGIGAIIPTLIYFIFTH